MLNWYLLLANICETVNWTISIVLYIKRYMYIIVKINVKAKVVLTEMIEFNLLSKS